MLKINNRIDSSCCSVTPPTRQEEMKFDFNTSRCYPTRGNMMQHDEKLETVKLMMLYHQGGPNGYNILILILVWRPTAKIIAKYDEWLML
jgi:hypothetical protein